MIPKRIWVSYHTTKIAEDMQISADDGITLSPIMHRYISAESIEALLSSHPTDGQPRSLADALRDLLEGK